MTGSAVSTELRTHQWRGVIEEYRDRLPVDGTTPVVTLREGGTPLVPAPVVSALTGCTVHLKVEGANPTGSFKDRGMTMAISKAAEDGAQAVICASTGNTSASAAAYAVRAGMLCAVLVPVGKDRAGQALAGPRPRRQAPPGRGQLRRLPHPGARPVRALPRRPGQQRQPLPHRGPEDGGLRDRRRPRRCPGHPRPPGRQRRQHHGLLEGLRRVRRRRSGQQASARCGASRRPEPRPSSTVRRWPSRRRSPRRSGSATRHPGSFAVAARDESGGRIDAVTDRDILKAYRLLAAQEGVFVEPASAASVAGLLQSHAAGLLEPGQTVVCTVTGHGLKDPDWAIAGAPAPVIVPVDAAVAAAELGLVG